jgi:hypothetical protein
MLSFNISKMRRLFGSMVEKKGSSGKLVKAAQTVKEDAQQNLLQKKDLYDK